MKKRNNPEQQKINFDSSLKLKEAYAFLGWCLEFCAADDEKIYKWQWKPNAALGIFSNNKNELFISRMVEKSTDDFEPPPKVRASKKIFETWSKKMVRKQWVATVESKPKIIAGLEPVSITYWSDKYKNDPMGDVYFHEFDPGLEFGFEKKRNLDKETPCALLVRGCKITARGIEG